MGTFSFSHTCGEDPPDDKKRVDEPVAMHPMRRGEREGDAHLESEVTLKDQLQHLVPPLCLQV